MRWTERTPGVAWRTIAEWRATLTGSATTWLLPEVEERIAARPDAELPSVVLWPEALLAAWSHVAGSPFERGGLLLGEPLLAANGDTAPALVSVRRAVAGDGSSASSVSLRLDTGVWDAARSALQPSEVIVGWFHSHPDLGAFFSGTDRRTQAGFFSHAFSLGWVIDPVRREQAWFVGPQSLPLPGHQLLVPAAGS